MILFPGLSGSLRVWGCSKAMLLSSFLFISALPALSTVLTWNRWSMFGEKNKQKTLVLFANRAKLGEPQSEKPKRQKKKEQKLRLLETQLLLWNVKRCFVRASGGSDLFWSFLLQHWISELVWFSPQNISRKHLQVFNWRREHAPI